VVFVEGQEFPVPTRRWAGFPEPRADEQYAAYVWASASFVVLDDTGRVVPSADWITPDDFDERRGGIPVAVSSVAGTTVLCAVAGIERRDSDPSTSLERLVSLERFVFGCSPPVFVPPGGESEEVRIEMSERLTGVLEIEVEPLPARDITNASAADAFDLSISPSVEVYGFSFLPLVPEQYRVQAASAPFTARFDQMLAGDYPDRWLRARLGPLGTVSLVQWGDCNSACSSSLLSRLDGTTRYVARPLGVPRILAPTQSGSFDRTIRFRTDGDGTPSLVQIRVSPERYTFGTGSPRWLIYARGDQREVRLPEPPASELELAPGVYEIAVVVDERERFDFDAWSFSALQDAPQRGSFNQIYARVPRGAP
jgi:hypothetical protein